MNSKGKKFKKPIHFSSFKTFQSFFFKHKTFDQKIDKRFCYIWGRTNHLAPQYFNRKKKSVKALPRGNGGNNVHKVNMVELDSNSFRLNYSLSIINSITFSSNWWLDSEANIYICIDRTWFESYKKQHGGSVSRQMTPPVNKGNWTHWYKDDLWKNSNSLRRPAYTHTSEKSDQQIFSS